MLPEKIFSKYKESGLTGWETLALPLSIASQCLDDLEADGRAIHRVDFFAMDHQLTRPFCVGSRDTFLSSDSIGRTVLDSASAARQLLDAAKGFEIEWVGFSCDRQPQLNGKIIGDRLSLLPGNLLKNALVSGDEAAWTKDDIPSVIDALNQYPVYVSGWEIWIRRLSGMGHPWGAVNGADGLGYLRSDLPKQACRYSNEAIKKSILDFEWAQHDKWNRILLPYFNLTYSLDDMP